MAALQTFDPMQNRPQSSMPRAQYRPTPLPSKPERIACFIFPTFPRSRSGQHVEKLAAEPWRTEFKPANFSR